jgi:hypothetical protein
VRATSSLRDTLVAEYEARAASITKPAEPTGNPSAHAGELASQRAWAWLFAYLLRPEPSFLLEVAGAIEAAEPDKAWMLYSRFLRLRPNTWQREDVERRLRSLMERLSGDLRDESRRFELVGQTLQGGEEAMTQGVLQVAERMLGLAYAMGGLPGKTLVRMARLQRRQGRYREEYVLWKRVQEEAETSTVPATLRSEAEQRLSELTRSPRSMNEPYVAATLGLYFGGRQIQYTGPGSLEGSTAETACGRLEDQRLGVYSPSPCPSFRQPLSLGVWGQLHLFPLASSGPRSLRGLGLRTTLQLQPGQRVCQKNGTDDSCQTGHSFRVENGLLWEYRRHPRGESPRTQVWGMHGYHALHLPAVVPANGWRTLQSPTYHTLTLGGEALLPVPVPSPLPWSMSLSLSYHLLLNQGALSDDSRGQYGPIASAHGLRAEFTPLRLRSYHGLVLLLAGQCELFQTSFVDADASLHGQSVASPSLNAEAPQQRGLAASIQDLQYGVRVGLHYEY